MPKFAVFQLTLSDEEYDEINEQGWGSPSGSLYLAARDGKPQLALETGHYRKVGVVETPSLHGTYSITQHGFGHWQDNPGVLEAEWDQVRSTQKGDIVKNIETGEAFIIAGHDFEPISAELAEMLQ